MSLNGNEEMDTGSFEKEEKMDDTLRTIKETEENHLGVLKKIKEMMSTADTMILTWEQETIVEIVKYLENLNTSLIQDLKAMQKKYENLQLETNQTNRELKRDINLLREELKEIEEARSFEVKIPESWIIKE